MDLEATVGRPVSRETIGRLEAYCELVRRWTPKINLVSHSAVAELWTRHILDSAQVYAVKPPNAMCWVDLGSGGGFPGVVVTILAAELDPDLEVTLVESDQRKSAFLRAALREAGVRARVHARRIDEIEPQSASVVSARALATLPVLLALVERHMAPDGVALLPKGARWRDEVDAARQIWRFTCEAHPSRTDPDAAILQIGDIVHV